MYLAWIWLFMTVLNILFVSEFNPENILVRIFDRIVLISSFLIYPFANVQEKSVLPFFYQFLFWWIFGALMLALYYYLDKKMSRKKP